MSVRGTIYILSLHKFDINVSTVMYVIIVHRMSINQWSFLKGSSEITNVILYNRERNLLSSNCSAS